MLIEFGNGYIFEATNHYTIDAVGTNMIRELLVFIVTEEYFPDYLSLLIQSLL
jgi:hypothetical protein